MAPRNTQKRGNCPCEGKTLERFIRPAVLIILAHAPRQYGYRIVQQLSEMPLCAGERPNAAGVYRCLRLMEQEGLVTSAWAVSETGPAKRLYTLTDEGERCMCRWLLTLNSYKEAIDDLLQLGKAVYGPGQHLAHVAVADSC